ncbi:MAG: HK97-gp10 family putative phage morphogenesis protein [Paraclostridium sp.]
MSLDYNFSALVDKLNDIDKRVKSKITKEVLLESAKPVLEAQKDIVPKGETENLLKSLDTGKFTTKKGQMRLHIGIVHNKDRSVTYGYYQHYGTRRMIGKYWINEAWVQSRKQAKEAMIVKLRAVIKG